MRRAALLLMVLVGAFGLVAAGCGGGDGAEGTTATETTDAGSAMEGDPVAGKNVFLVQASCGGCHTLADAGTSGSVGPNLDDSQPSYDLVLDRVTNGQGGMPSFADSLSEQEIADVAAYVSSVAGG